MQTLICHIFALKIEIHFVPSQGKWSTFYILSLDNLNEWIICPWISLEYITAAKKKYEKVENETDAKLLFAHSQSQMNR